MLREGYNAHICRQRFCTWYLVVDRKLLVALRWDDESLATSKSHGSKGKGVFGGRNVTWTMTLLFEGAFVVKKDKDIL